MRFQLLAAGSAALVVGLGAAWQVRADEVRVDSGVISGLGARNIGSAAMSGRISALAGFNDPSGKLNLFVGAASGGVWKSTDGGTIFKPVFDKQPVQSIGAIAIDPSHPANMWVGTGEAWTRNSVSVGDGIYKSTDGGETWTHAGLPDSERISRILVDPRAADTVYACVPGKLWSDSAERGLYKTTDGGQSWQLVLKGANLSTGCGDVKMEPGNPDMLLASSVGLPPQGLDVPLRRRRAEDALRQRPVSQRGRRQDLDRAHPAIQQGAASQALRPPGSWRLRRATPRTIYVFIESTDSGLFISHDGGATWERGDKSQWMVWRPFYFANLIVDPKNAKRVFKTDGNLILSEDGGQQLHHRRRLPGCAR